MHDRQHEPGRLNRISGRLIASTMAVALLAAAPAILLPGHNGQALADPVRVDAPQAPSFADVVEAVRPAVVSVRVESDLRPASDRGFRFDRRDMEDLPPFLREHPFFERFFEYDDNDRRFGRRDGDRRRYGRRGDEDDQRRRGPRRFGTSQGSGFFVTDDGYIVTNHHVVENGSKFTVVMDDGTELDAKLVGADTRSDLAVLKVENGREFTYVKFSDTPVRVGEWVVAVGNPFGLGGTVTAGIVSAHNRAIRTNVYDDFIQIDAAVNKGNSGGPAFNLNGEVIGVNNQIFSPSGGNVGIAFAIPASTARDVVDDLIDNGQVVRGWLGVQIQPVTSDIAESVELAEAAGAIVTEPQDGSPADDAGIRPGDVITAVDGEKVKGPRELARKIASYEPESEVSVTVWRDGEFRDISVTLGRLEEQAAMRGERRAPAMRSLARLGLELESAEDGVRVVDVVPGSPAAEKRLRSGDVILSVNGEEVSDPQDVLEIVQQATRLGRKATLFQIESGDQSRFVAIPLKRG